MNLVLLAHKFAKEKHKGQRYGNKDYFDSHICKVVDSIAISLQGAKLSEDQVNLIKVVAYLHDVVEDCNVTLQEIEDSFGCEVATYVGLLTKNKDEDRLVYLERVALCSVAKLVKLHDATANATQCFTDGDTKRFNKYLKYIGVLGGSSEVV